MHVSALTMRVKIAFERCAPVQSTLAGFRSKKFRVLVATDVAARGLDIKEVELVIMTDPPKDPETYIHRSVNL